MFVLPLGPDLLLQYYGRNFVKNVKLLFTQCKVISDIER